MKYLLDTNIVSEPTKRKPAEAVLHHIKRHAGQMVVASLSVHEMIHGIERLPEGRKKEVLEAYVTAIRATLPVIPYGERAAEWHAMERARLERIGKTMPFIDGQIAAIAYVNDLTLVTANVRHFSAFDGLEVENWLE
ncbi:MAG TPA: type II toxin-antitoxin system VapC family toxin [Polyangiaceae bacterium]|nr:type II toxin-antitoxin system VapC family toxin [Polyangiaceae bacterium]